jgi:molecular chaperone GrpE
MVILMGEAKEGKKERSKKNIKLKNELKAKTKEAEEYLTNLKYLKADFENYKKRMEREKEDLCRFATESLILEILEVVDNLERAIEAGKAGEGDKKNLLEGVEMTYKQLMKIFEKQGVNTDKFEEDTVIQELLKGYTMNSRVIRHSRVKIAKNS